MLIPNLIQYSASNSSLNNCNKEPLFSFQMMVLVDLHQEENAKLSLNKINRQNQCFTIIGSLVQHPVYLFIGLSCTTTTNRYIYTHSDTSRRAVQTREDQHGDEYLSHTTTSISSTSSFKTIRTLQKRIYSPSIHSSNFLVILGLSPLFEIIFKTQKQRILIRDPLFKWGYSVGKPPVFNIQFMTGEIRVATIPTRSMLVYKECRNPIH